MKLTASMTLTTNPFAGRKLLNETKYLNWSLYTQSMTEGTLGRERRPVATLVLFFSIQPGQAVTAHRSLTFAGQ